MFSFIRFIVILIIAYSAGFISGMRYQGDLNETEALKEHLKQQLNNATEKGKALIEKVQ